MARPLYKTEGQLPARRAPEGHTGLWFDKFCDRWRNDGDVWTMKSPKNDDKEPKLDWIEGVTEGSIGKSSQIHESAMRSMRLIERRGGHAAVFVTEFRFVTGLGRSHPIENGFAWHPTLGTPYLPAVRSRGWYDRGRSSTATRHRTGKPSCTCSGTSGRPGISASWMPYLLNLCNWKPTS